MTIFDNTHPTENGSHKTPDRKPHQENSSRADRTIGVTGNLRSQNQNTTEGATTSSPSSGNSVIEWLSKYQPVLALLITSLMGAACLSARSPLAPEAFMTHFMGLALLIFSALKLFDVSGFQSGFAKYDLVSTRWSQYGYWYPFAELLLALGFLAGYGISVFAFLTILLMSTTATGVLFAMIKGKKLDCVCVGSQVDVPLGSMSLIESVGMGVMAVFLFARSLPTL